jgi:aspartate/methionine/tyrosine aminotransferase
LLIFKSKSNGSQKSILESEDEKDVDYVVEKIRVKFTEKTRVLSIVTPGNPFSAVYPEKLLTKLQQLCEANKIWLVVDETYEDFIFENKTHFSVDGENVVNLFSFSKVHFEIDRFNIQAYGIAGWRVGYIAFPDGMKDALDKIQDTSKSNILLKCDILKIPSIVLK